MNYLGIEKGTLSPVVKELNQLLSNYHIYYQNLRNFHWNVQGSNFFDLHTHFEDLYNDAREKIDAIAERILTLRHTPLSELSAYLDYAQIREAGTIKDDREMVQIILKNHEIIISNLRTIIAKAELANDEGTIDMIGGFLGEIEKKSWMLDAWSVRKLEPSRIF